MTRGETSGFEAIPLWVGTALARVHQAPSLKDAARQLVEAARLTGVEASVGFATRATDGEAWTWHEAGEDHACEPALREALQPNTPADEAARRLLQAPACTAAAQVDGLPPGAAAVAFATLPGAGENHALLELLVSHAAVAAAGIIRSRRSAAEVRAYQTLAALQREAHEALDPLTLVAKSLPAILRRAPAAVTRCTISLSALDELGYGPQRFALGRDDLAVRRLELRPEGEPETTGADAEPGQPPEQDTTQRVTAPLASLGHRHGELTVDLLPGTEGREEILHFARAVASALATTLARLRAEAAGARGQTVVRGVLDILPDPALVHRDGKIVFANGRLMEFLGYSREELLGAPVLTVIAPQDREVAAARIRSQLATGGPVPPIIEHVQKKDGTIALAEIAARPAMFEGAAASIVVARDVTEREELQRRAAEADRLATVGALAAGIGHEINNPLTYIKGNLQYLRYRLGDALDDELQAAVRDAETGAQRIETITKTIRLLGSTGRAERTVVPLAEAVEGAYRVVAQQLDPVAEVTLDVPGTLQVRASAEGLSQLLTKLLSNAADALETETRRRGRLTVRARPVGGRVEVVFEDNGPGVSEHLRERIFLPFVTTKEVGEGSGLGLAVARQVVVDHGGALTVEDTPGGGATFRFSLPGGPAARAGDSPASSADADLQRTRGKLRVLLVDDDPLITEVLKRLLHRSMDVATRGSAADALQLLAETGPVFDALVFDVAMPQMSGIELADEVSRRWPELRPKILLMTGAAISRDLAEQLRASPYPRHIKPIGRRRILAFAEQASGLSRGAAEAPDTGGFQRSPFAPPAGAAPTPSLGPPRGLASGVSSPNASSGDTTK